MLHDPARQRRRSATSSDYMVPRTRTKFGDRAFSVAGPKVWNSLPEPVRAANTFDCFKRKLKTYLFNIVSDFYPNFYVVMPRRYVSCIGWLGSKPHISVLSYSKRENRRSFTASIEVRRGCTQPRRVSQALPGMQLGMHARIPSNIASFVGLTSYCYRNLCTKMHQNMPFPDEKKLKKISGEGV